MAVRPTIPIDIRASQANYTTGDPALIGTPTKIARSGADVTEGYKVDTAASPAPVFAQNVNYEDNRNDQWLFWVTQGSDSPTADAHIVETNTGGFINVRGAQITEVSISTNGTDRGITINAFSGSTGILINRDNGHNDPGLRIIGFDGATDPSILVENTNVTGADIQITESGNGANIAHQSGVGLQISGTPDAGNQGPSIKINPSATESSDLSVGTFWNMSVGGIFQMKMGIGAASPGYMMASLNSPCYARSATVVSFGMVGNASNQPMAADFSFQSGFVPQAAELVKVTIWGKINMPQNESSDIFVKVLDRTNADATICEINVNNANDATWTVNPGQSTTFSAVYTLPAAGARDFALVWSGSVAASQATWTGFAEVEALRGA